MTIPDAIKLAIKEGYKMPVSFKWSDIFLDPQFWQCLGKAMRWEKGYKVKGMQGFHISKCCGAKIVLYANHKQCTNCEKMEWEGVDSCEPWLYRQHQFIDHLASGKSAESYFETL
jgi:hypothetical protein